MNLEEANARLKTTQINEDQLWGLNSLYLILDLDKDDFCKIIDLVGADKLLDKRSLYDRYFKAEEELTAKERYKAALRRLEELKEEKTALEELVNKYDPLA